MKKLSKIHSRNTLIKIYQSFLSPHFENADVLYDQRNNESIFLRTKNDQCNAAISITDAIKGASQMKWYNEIALESLKLRQWFRKH